MSATITIALMDLERTVKKMNKAVEMTMNKTIYQKIDKIVRVVAMASVAQVKKLEQTLRRYHWFSIKQ